MNSKIIIIWFILLKTNFNFYLCASNSDWIEMIAEKVDSEIKFKQIVIFMFNRLSNDNYDDLILSEITKRAPTILINMEKNTSVSKFSSPVFENPRNYLSFITILRGHNKKSHWQKIKDVIELINGISISAPRPKLMVISVDRDAWNISHFKKILLKSWKRKYLDFTIVGNSKEGDFKIMHYNPFNDTYFIGSFNSTAKIFPDKMKNMYGYALKIPTFTNEINSKFFHKSFNKTKTIYEICKILNCILKMEVVEKSFSNIDDFLEEVFNSLKRNEFQIVEPGENF